MSHSGTDAYQTCHTFPPSIILVMLKPLRLPSKPFDRSTRYEVNITIVFFLLFAAPHQIAFRALREKHIPLAQKEFTDKHLPNAVAAGKAAGAHLTRVLSIAGEHFQKGYTAAGEHIKNGYTATSSAVRNHVRLISHFSFPIPRTSNLEPRTSKIEDRSSRFSVFFALGTFGCRSSAWLAEQSTS